MNQGKLRIRTSALFRRIFGIWTFLSHFLQRRKKNGLVSFVTKVSAGKFGFHISSRKSTFESLTFSTIDGATSKDSNVSVHNSRALYRFENNLSRKNENLDKLCALCIFIKLFLLRKRVLFNRITKLIKKYFL